MKVLLSCCLTENTKRHEENLDLVKAFAKAPRSKVKEDKKVKNDLSFLSETKKNLKDELRIETNVEPPKANVVVNSAPTEEHSLAAAANGTKVTSNISSNSGIPNFLPIGMQQSSCTIEDDVPPTEAEFSSQIITPEIVKTGSRLVIEVVFGGVIFRVVDANEMKLGTIARLLPNGMIDGKHQKNDGCSYFGTGADADFTIPETEGCASKHFTVQYSVGRNAYFLKDLKEGTGTFSRLDRSFVFSTDSIIIKN